MGRIAEALKKAQEERSNRLHVGGGSGGSDIGGAILTPDSPGRVQRREAPTASGRLAGEVR